MDICTCDDVCDDVRDQNVDGDGDVCVSVPELNICISAHSHAAVYKNTRGGSIK